MKRLAEVFVLLSCALQAADTVGDLRAALTGAWVGTLEYRDFSEPANSTKRVKLPTWLTVEAAGDGLQFRYTYDDGPGKTVTDTETVHIDGARYQILGKDGKLEDTYEIAGLTDLKDGRGTLILTGPGIENKAPVNVRTTLHIGRNLLEITRETAPEGQPWAFRHTYTFVRAERPLPKP